jgi:hypothetical protein
VGSDVAEVIEHSAWPLLDEARKAVDEILFTCGLPHQDFRLFRPTVRGGVPCVTRSQKRVPRPERPRSERPIALWLDPSWSALDLIERLKKGGLEIKQEREPGGAWFLGSPMKADN